MLSPEQLGLDLLLLRPSLFAIPKASRCERVEQNAVAAQVTLTADETGCIEDALPRGGGDPACRCCDAGEGRRRYLA